MPKDRDDELNRHGGPTPEFTLEEILAEYRDRRESGLDDDIIPLPVIPQKDLPPEHRAGRRKGTGNNVVRFPGKRSRPVPPPEEEPEEDDEEETTARFPGASPVSDRPDEPEEDPPVSEDEDAEDDASEDSGEPDDGDETPPEAESPKAFFSARLDALRRKADDYADHMFEEEGIEDDEDVRRAEKYLPGVDREEERPPFRIRPPRRVIPPAPDIPPAELFKRYGRGLKFLRMRTTMVLLLSLPLIYLTLAPFFRMPLPGMLANSYELQVYTLAGLLGGVMLLGIDVLLRGLFQLLRLQMGMDTLVSFSCIATLADALTMISLGGREGELPYCAVSALALGLTMWGTVLKLQGQRAACRTAASAHEPYLVTLDSGKWNGREAYTKWSGDPAGFGSQIQGADGAQRIFRVTAPLIFIASFLFSILSSLGRQRPELILWCLSATLTAGASFSAALCFGMPWNSLCRRLSGVGAAIAGWDGVAGGTGAGILLTDTDLFPPGSVALNGIKIFGNFSVEKVVAVTATLIRDSGSGLDKIFHDLLRSQGAIYRRCSAFERCEGGLAANIRGEQILVGSASFMHLMGVALPQGLIVKNAVFCAIDGELAGLFALNYNLHGAVRPALTALIRNKIGPVLCTRDFNLIPAMLRQRFKLPVEKMEFPEMVRRTELSDPDQEHSDTLSAVLCREGLGPFSEAVVGGRRLRQAVRGSAALASVGSALGVLLAFYLTFVASYSSLSPANLLIFMVLWLVPTLLISGWVNRY